MAGDGKDLATLFHKENTHWHVQVGVAGLLVVVEDTDTIRCAAENTPALLPALRERRRGERRKGEEREGGKEGGREEGR